MNEKQPRSRKKKPFPVKAVAIAAAVLVSGSAITAAAATGGFSQLMQLVFGKDVSYPSTLEDLYTVPEVEVTDTCDGIDCQVLGVFGDACSVNVVLEFSGVNGFTLSENVQLFGESPWILGDGVGGWRGSTDYTYDASTAEIDGQLVGLLIDENNEADKTELRIQNWTDALKKEI